MAAGKRAKEKGKKPSRTHFRRCRGSLASAQGEALAQVRRGRSDQRDADSVSKRAEANLNQQGQRQQAILATIPEIIMEVDSNKFYVWANSAGLEFYGPDVVGKEAAYYFEGEQDTYAKVESLFKGDESVIYLESWQRRRDGQKRLLAWWCKVLKDFQGRTIGALSTARDITDQKITETALRESERKYRELIESINDVLYSVTEEGEILFVSPSAEGVLGYALEEIAARNFMSFVWPEDIPLVQKALADIISGRMYPSEYQMVKKDGTRVWVRTSSRLIPGEGGTKGRITGVLVNISDRKRAEQELEQHRLRLEEMVQERTAELVRTRQQIENILHSAGEGIFGLDLEGRLTFINEAGARLLGWRADDLIGQEIHPLIHAARLDGTPCAWEECPIRHVLTAGVPCSEARAQCRRKDGTFFYAEFTGVALLAGDSPIGAVIVFRDITERSRAEEERKKQVEDLEKFNKAMIGREMRIIEIKEEVNRLCLELGREPKYPIIWK